MKKLLLLLPLVLAGLSFSKNKSNAGGQNSGDGLKINQVQIIASHNSYHLRTDPAILRFLMTLHNMNILPAGLDPREIDYTNATLTGQLEKYGVRGLELDVWNDTKGGRFYYRRGKAYVFKKTASHIEALKQPGFKMLHIPDFDFNSTNNTFIEALAEIKKWSDLHPNHLPLFINVEVKTRAAGDEVPYIHTLAKAEPFDSLAAVNLDNEVKSVFGENLDKVITPDKVRGNYATLEAAVLAGNWPALSASRGKVIFIIDHDDQTAVVYKTGHPSLKGRAMFMYAPAGTPEAAFVIFDEPKELSAIQQSVKQGYIVRTRSDEGTWQARTGDYSQMKLALDSWAQIISTDYYRPDPRAIEHPRQWTNYHVQVPGGGMARIDSISAPGKLNAAEIKE